MILHLFCIPVELQNFHHLVVFLLNLPANISKSDNLIQFVVLFSSNQACNTSEHRATYNLGPADRGLLVMPLFHVNGLMAGLLAPLFSGRSVIITITISQH